MIERYTLTSLDGVAAALGVAAPDGPPRFNIAPLARAPICTAGGAELARWGMLPPWRGHGGKRGPHILHAPLDAIDGVPVIRNAFKARRCLVIADGFYAWRRTGKKSQPLWLHPAPDPATPGARSRPVGFAGVSVIHRDDGEPSFAFLVGPAAPLVAPIDAAMPIAIPADRCAAWLTAPRDAARDILLAAAGQLAGWRADPVSNRVNAVEHDDAGCVESLGNPNQGELFDP